MSDPRSLFRTPSRLLARTRYVLGDYLLLRASIPVGFIALVAWAVIRSTLQSAGPGQWADPRFIAGTHSAYGSFSALLLYSSAFLFAFSAQTTLIGYASPPKWLEVFAKVMPPATDFEKVRAQINAAQVVASNRLWHVLAYGAAGWIHGLIFLRRRQIAR